MSDILPRNVLDRERQAIRAVLASFGVSEAGVFGSVARREDTPNSDLDLIVRFIDGHPKDLIGLTDALTALTGVHVDVVDEERIFSRARATGVGGSILRETVPL